MEKRFVFKIKFCTAKIMGMFRWSGSVFDRLIPERMISSFLFLEKVLNRGRYSEIFVKRLSLSS